MSIPYDPSYTAVFVVANFIYLGTTEVEIGTSDQSPVIDSITPASADAGTTTQIVITGSNFGLNPVIEFSGGGISSNVNSFTNTQINATLAIDANTPFGDQTVDILSSGAAGLGFLPAPNKSPRSNPKKFTVTGANFSCPVTISNDGQKYSLGADYLTATIPLRAESPCAGTVSWSIAFVYFTTSNKGSSKAGPFVVPDSLRTPAQPGAYSYQTPPGTGGRVDVTATITINGTTTKSAVTFYVDGFVIPLEIANARLVQLYQGGGNTHLMTGIAATESTTKQFGKSGNPFMLFGQTGLWPNESYSKKEGYGSHIGLMQVPTKMLTAYNWEQNTLDGVNLFANDKLRRAGNYEDKVRAEHPGLRAMTLQESERNGLVHYGPWADSVRNVGSYWAANAKGTDWIVNTKNPGAVKYVDDVYSKIQ